MADVTYVFDLDGYMQAIIRGTYRAMVQVGRELQSEIRTELSQPGTGRLHSGWGLKYRSSAPGKPPAVQSGRLRNSWLADSIPRVSGNRLSLRVASKLPYAAILQFGGVTGKNRRTKIAPRPYLNRPAKTVAERFPQVITSEIASAIDAINKGST